MKVELREGDGQRGWQSFLLRGWPGSLGSSPGGRQGAVTCHVAAQHVASQADNGTLTPQS